MKQLNLCQINKRNSPMKIRHLFLLFAAIAIILPSCEKVDFYELGPSSPSVDIYLLGISFRDVSGHDYVAPLGDEKWKPANDHSKWYGEINPDKYDLDITISNPSEVQYNPNYIPAQTRQRFMMTKLDSDYALVDEGAGVWYLCNEFGVSGKEGIQDHLTYKFRCQTVFGDNSEHEIVAWWDKDPLVEDHSKDRVTGSLYPECVKATFDGKAVPVKKATFTNNNFSFYYYFIDIILDR